MSVGLICLIGYCSYRTESIFLGLVHFIQYMALIIDIFSNSKTYRAYTVHIYTHLLLYWEYLIMELFNQPIMWQPGSRYKSKAILILS